MCRLFQPPDIQHAQNRVVAARDSEIWRLTRPEVAVRMLDAANHAAFEVERTRPARKEFYRFECRKYSRINALRIIVSGEQKVSAVAVPDHENSSQRAAVGIYSLDHGAA